MVLTNYGVDGRIVDAGSNVAKVFLFLRPFSTGNWAYIPKMMTWPNHPNAANPALAIFFHSKHHLSGVAGRERWAPTIWISAG